MADRILPGYHEMPDGSLMKDNEMSGAGQAGPPAPESRLETLKAHQTALEATPEPVASPTLVKALLPILLAQGLDFVSTEEPIGFLRRDDMAEYMNRFPGARAQGFAGTAGRMGSGALELALAALLNKASPTLGRAYAVPSISTHMDLAKGNLIQASERDRVDRLKGGR